MLILYLIGYKYMHLYNTIEVEKAVVTLEKLLNQDTKEDIIQAIRQFKSTGDIDVEVLKRLNEFAI